MIFYLSASAEVLMNTKSFIRTSHSPPELGSPMFSPIRKGKTATIDNNKGSVEDVNFSRHDILGKLLGVVK